MKKNALLIIALSILVTAIIVGPALTAEAQIDSAGEPTPTPDSQTLDETMNPQLPPPFVVPEYPLLGGIVAMLACFAALAVVKLRKAKQ